MREEQKKKERGWWEDWRVRKGKRSKEKGGKSLWKNEYGGNKRLKKRKWCHEKRKRS